MGFSGRKVIDSLYDVEFTALLASLRDGAVQRALVSLFLNALSQSWYLTLARLLAIWYVLLVL